MMKKLLFVFAAIVILAMTFVPSLPVSAKKGDVYAFAVGVPVAIDNNVDVTYTGKTYKVNGENKYEYVARISQAPIYNDDGTLVDCSWHGSEDAYAIVNNVFSAQVIGSLTTVTYQGQSMSWNPIVYVDSKEYVAKSKCTLLAVDPINSNYQNNTLEWDYGVCVRRVRVIEGLIQETYIFDKDPKGTVWIKDNAQKSAGFTWAISPYAYDSAGNSLPINEYKQVSASAMSSAVYPVTIDPTDSFVTSASDAEVVATDVTWATAWAATSAGTIYDTQISLIIGSYYTGSAWGVWRSGVYFDTSAIPDSASISAVNLSLYGYQDYSVNDFNISVTNGQPTYPHDPMVLGDYNKANYTGLGNAGFATSGFSTAGYNNVSLNTTGISWISVTGTTKLLLRSSKDISGTAPTGTSHEAVTVFSYEKGSGFQPTLYVTYTSSGVPTVTTNPATYVTRTSARLNGYVNADGGEADTVSFNYHPWYSSGWRDCIEFTINASYVDADLTNFPVLITGSQLNTTDTDFWTTVNTTGSDILFTNSAGAKLNRELVSIDTTNKSMECYVNVTSIDDTDNTKIYMYYNSANISLYNESNSTATWNPEYISVWHMGDSPNTSTIQDSTSFNRDGVKASAGNPAEIVGIFSGDKAQLFDGATTDYVNVSIPLTSTTDITVEVIAKSGNASGIHFVVAAGIYSVRQAAGPVMYGRGDNAGAMQTDTIAISTSAYSYNVITYDQDGVNSILDSRVDTTVGTPNSYAKLSTASVGGWLGTYSAAGANPIYYYNGSMSEVRVSNVSRSASWQKASYYSLISPTTFCPVTDVFTSTSTQSKSTGESFYIDQTGLTANTLYGYKAEAVNSYGTSWGAWVLFNTSVTLQAPSNGICSPTSDSINLTWTKGGNSSTTYIRWKTGGYPTGTSDGNLLCNTSDVGFSHTGLTSGTTYYYRLWGCDSGNYSSTNTTIMCTTIAGATAEATPSAPSAPDTWTSGANASTVENLPIYDIGNSFWDTFQMPHNSGWMIAAISFAMVSGFIIYSRSKNLLVAILTVMILAIVLSIIGLMPMWFVYAFAIMSLGFAWKELR